MTTFSATYSPDDNKLRLYASSRLDSETYARVKAAGFKWAPKQDLFVVPMWTPGREDLLIELAGEIDDEDKSLVERAEERADRFEEYSDKRMTDAENARQAVERITDGIPLGQPILVGHHSEKHARRDAERIESGMRKAVKMWETSNYWTARAKGAVRAAKYKERPDVRARRIKTIEADKRKQERRRDEAAKFLKVWTNLEKIAENDRHEIARKIANVEQVMSGVRLADGSDYYSAWGALTDGKITAEEVRAQRLEGLPLMIAHCERWIAHYENRVAYERAMLGDTGGTAADKTGPEKGGAVRCWASPGYGRGWSYIRKVNKVSVTVDDVAAYGGRVYSRTMPFDKLAAVMSAAEVEAARAEGRLQETAEKDGFFLTAPAPVEEEAPAIDTPEPVESETAPDPAPVSVESERRRDGLPVSVYGPDQAWGYPAGLIATPAPEPVESAAPAALVVAESYQAPPVAANDPFQAMRDSLRSGGVKVTVAAQLFPTPRELAARMVDEAGGFRPGMRMLEPSAGTGRLIDAALMADAAPSEIVAVEISPPLASALLAKYQGAARVHHGSFLETGPDLLGLFDVVLMNPPFADQADIAHVRHAVQFLKPGGRLVAIMSAGVTFRSDRKAEEFRTFVESRGGTIEPLPPDTFKESGTGVNSVLVVIDGE
jgi:phospholipid N-methyltransferase/outer membrane murein-binding lipoprotein Lpp